MPFAKLGLRSELIEAVVAKGYDTPSPIQERAIPAILERRDVIGGAQTGTGKTAAFSLPMLQLLAESSFNNKRPRALVLTPTRELASQVHQSIRDYGQKLNLRSVVIFGGVGFGPQITAFRRGVDIVVATPGRLLDLMQRREANLSNVEILVLDEADRMLDMGFIHDIKKILKEVPSERQNLFFSATYSKEVKKFSDAVLHDPIEVEVSARNSTAERVDQEAYIVGQKSKRAMLSSMIKNGKWSQVLVFTRTKHGANRLATQLEKDDISAMAIHGNKSQSARERALASFKANRIEVLVATDIAARGLDIADLPYVVNYELPNVAEDYVHRIGRTGRAGKAGKAISLVCENEEDYLWDIEKLLKREIPIFLIDQNGERREAEMDRKPSGKKRTKTQNRGGSGSRNYGGGGGRGRNPRGGGGNRNPRGGGGGQRGGGGRGRNSEGGNSTSGGPSQNKRRRPGGQGNRQRSEGNASEGSSQASKPPTFRSKLNNLLSRGR